MQKKKDAFAFGKHMDPLHLEPLLEVSWVTVSIRFFGALGVFTPGFRCMSVRSDNYIVIYNHMLMPGVNAVLRNPLMMECFSPVCCTHFSQPAVDSNINPLKICDVNSTTFGQLSKGTTRNKLCQRQSHGERSFWIHFVGIFSPSWDRLKNVQV